MSWDTPRADGDWGGGDENVAPTSNSLGTADATNGFSIDAENMSKHHTGGCFNCGQEGHNKAECTEPPQNSGECYNCGEFGHNKAECTNPHVERAFTGQCNECGEQGHRAAQCPKRPPQACRACRQEGHVAADCTNPFAVYDARIPMLDADEAWSLLVAADKSKEPVAFRYALDCYTRRAPDLTFVEMEKELRAAGLFFHLVAKEQPIADTKTIVNLQGQKDCTYVISFQAGYKPTRPKFASGWPASAEDNLARLEQAGYVMDRGIPKCSNCDEMGHIAKTCSSERIERPKSEVKCFNCNEVGHYLRDCINPRQDRNACRNCKQPGHKAADCTEPRSAEGVECRNCGETGHFVKDCPTRQVFACRKCGDEGHKAAECPSAPALTCYNCYQEGHGSRDCPNEKVMKCRNCDQVGHMSRDCTEPPNPANMKCRNCDDMGHMSRDCPKPRDYSRVRCRNCGEYGHTRVRCNNPPVEETAQTMADTNGGAEDWATNAATTSGVQGGWDTAPAVTETFAAADEGGWGVPGEGTTATW
ncbi:DNA-binding protein HEXBP [Sphaceloma murrayae]|uniref:DNA-binding protein HEXBP n=1 Tax=Sphaceloma murrayae TaxID=2082308 RepID=A0A2K1QVR1_9PEZI|nr:DNA-binding protein HEXBP [Sphaceloma murrayae]